MGYQCVRFLMRVFDLQCNGIVIFCRIFQSKARFLKLVFSVDMDLVSMVANYEEAMEIILLTYHEMKSTVMGFHVYRNKWESVIGEILNTRMESQTEVDKYAVAVLDKVKSVIYQKGQVENMPKPSFTS